MLLFLLFPFLVIVVRCAQGVNEFVYPPFSNSPTEGFIFDLGSFQEIRWVSNWTTVSLSLRRKEDNILLQNVTQGLIYPNSENTNETGWTVQSDYDVVEYPIYYLVLFNEDQSEWMTCQYFNISLETKSKNDVDAYLASITTAPGYSFVQSYLSTALSSPIYQEVEELFELSESNVELTQYSAIQSAFTALPDDVISYLSSVAEAENPIWSSDGFTDPANILGVLSGAAITNSASFTGVTAFPTLTSTTTSQTTTTTPAATAPASPISPTLTPSQGLSSGAKAGIGVGVAIGILLLAAAAWFIWRWRRRQASKEHSTPAVEKPLSEDNHIAIAARPLRPVELSDEPRQPTELSERNSQPAELSSSHSVSRHELNGIMSPVEMRS